MIRIWNVTIKKSTERRKDIVHSIGIEEANHELIVWKHWVGFLPKNDFFHHVILRQNLYILMDALLKIGTYSICMKRENNTHLYSANIVGISPYMLENVTGYERHTILAKFQDLTELGYISFTAPTRGELSEMNILLNDYNKAGLQVFQIEERSWLNERMIVEKESLFGEYGDIREIGSKNDFNGSGIVGMLPIIIQQQGGSSVESLPINPVDNPVGMVDKSDTTVETLPISESQIMDDLMYAEDGLISKTSADYMICDETGFEGIAKNLIISLRGIATNRSRGGRGGPDSKDSKDSKDYSEIRERRTNVKRLYEPQANNAALRSQKMDFSKNDTKNEEKKANVPNRPTPTPTAVGLGNRQTTGGFFLTSPTSTTSTPNVPTKDSFNFDPAKYSNSIQIVGMFYQLETKLVLTEQDVQFINESLKISAIPQICTAIQSAKVWRATLPANFDKLSEEEKRQRALESQPGFYLKKMGMKHVYNFLKNSPRYRKRGRRGISTGVKSGLNRKRVLAQQTKIIKEIHEKHKKEIEQKK